jgi:hypothetical protein
MFERNFQQGGTAGGRWAAWSNSTKAARDMQLGTYAQGVGGDQVLTATGELRSSFTQATHSQHISRITGSGGDFQLRIGSSHPLAALHHEGGTFTRGPISGKGILRWYDESGEPVFAHSTAGATFTIPERKIWDAAEIQDVAFRAMAADVESRVQVSWRNG